MTVHAATRQHTVPVEPLPMGGPLLWLFVELKRRRARAAATRR